MLSALLILFVTCIIIVDVLGRGLFNSPLTGTVEIVSNVIVVIAFLQISYAIQTNGMFHTDMFVNLMPSSIKKALQLLAELAGAALIAMMIYASWGDMMLVNTTVVVSFASRFTQFAQSSFRAAFLHF
ncbi:TRAP transporter small permease subunit [Pseudovibrio sp. Tun.PSC04-5.I4]|uniref:TRAP transporter small permease n=1 Tax=Pseudovibrio sp. Tun.PSC04-5.I4 TaxID=1798213 RepID=UPI000A604BB6|nr:TRAP transporter small permease subunit [Pseudovibrio sp. Tun.PSC04-5.I4]